jgi:hypothetical protein
MTEIQLFSSPSHLKKAFYENAKENIRVNSTSTLSPTPLLFNQIISILINLKNGTQLLC